MSVFKFTSENGWYGVIGKDFTFDRLHLVIQAFAEYIKTQNKIQQGVIVGYDNRFLSEEFARQSTCILAANGFPILFCQEATPTPVISYATYKHQRAGAIIITASHSPPEYNGIKFRNCYGGPVLPEVVAQIERYLDRVAQLRSWLKFMPFDQAVKEGRISFLDPKEVYLKRLRELVKFDQIAHSRLKVVVDPIHGTAKGFLSTLLQGTSCEVIEIRTNRDPLFGGINPEPIERNLGYLIDIVRGTGADVGFAFDGDGDQVSAIDATGEFISPNQIFALLLQHLCLSRSDSRRVVVKTVSTTSMIDELARRYRLKLYETPCGSKYLSRLLLSKDILIANEENQGITIGAHIPQSDGILSALLLLEIIADTKRTLGQCVRNLMKRVGPHFYDQTELEIDEEKREKLNQICARPPEYLGGSRVIKVQNLDGLKLFFSDGSWVLLRIVDNEPLVRLYAEASNKEKVTELLRSARQLIGG